MRLPHLRPDELNREQHHLYETINQGPRRVAHPGLVSPVGLVDPEGRLQGPFAYAASQVYARRLRRAARQR